MKILYVGETWRGSSARSLREALATASDVSIEDIGEDHYLPRYRSRALRALNRVIRPLQIAELAREVSGRCEIVKPQVLLVYKGNGIRASLLRHLKAAGVLTVNVFPDYSPHAYGTGLIDAIREYDLVISTKPFHPKSWKSLYGYDNRCVFVPHGYDPGVHCWSELPPRQEFDVVLAAGWRHEYHRLMLNFARATSDLSLTVGLAGPGWAERRGDFPPHWIFAGTRQGRAYGEWLRRGRIAIAPVNREVVVAGRSQPGDEDTTRTYELAAAHCFFLHRRTDYVKTIYDEQTEVPLWDDAAELARLVRHYLPREDERRAMAAAAHARAVPAYSIPNRAQQVLSIVRDQLSSSRGGRT